MLSIWIIGLVVVLTQVRSQILPPTHNLWNRHLQITSPQPIPQPTSQQTLPQYQHIPPVPHMPNSWSAMQNQTPHQPMYPNVNPFQGTMPVQTMPNMHQHRRPGVSPIAHHGSIPGVIPGCMPNFYHPLLCKTNGENQHKYTLQAVMKFLGDKNMEKVGHCVPGIQQVNCSDYNAAQYIWKTGYCYCKRYHNNLSSFMGMPRLRCVLNNCGGCAQEFYLGKSRIVDCD